MNRREFLKSLGISGLWMLAGGWKLALAGGENGLIRPPGSVDEDSFNSLCIRCGECIKACPAKCLRPVPAGRNIIALQTPYILPRKAGCIRCKSCAAVCPTGAIVKVPVEAVKMGTARIYTETCLVWTDQKECLVCLEYCPVRAIQTDSRGRPTVDPAVCVGCGVCENNCPVLGDTAAIRVTPDGEKRYHVRQKYYGTAKKI